MAAHLGLGQRIGEFGPPALPLLAQRLRLLVRSGAFACHLLRVERQAQPYFGTHYRRISLHGLLAVDTCILLVQQVDPLSKTTAPTLNPCSHRRLLASRSDTPITFGTTTTESPSATPT